MNKIKLQTSNLKIYFWIFCLLFSGFAAFSLLERVSAQNAENSQTLPPTHFRIGERLTYTISFEKFNNAAYAEIYVVSRGKLEGKDAVELHAKIKTKNVVSAAFYLLDEARTTFASAETGLPLFVRNVSNDSILPVETVNNFLIAPTSNYDLLTLIYHIRRLGGIGTFTFQDNDKTYTVSLQNTIGERVKTDAGDFDTTVSTVQSDFLTEKGITNLSINFNNYGSRLPVLFRFRTAKGEFRATIASVQTIIPDTGNNQTPTPTPTSTPEPATTPIPAPVYIENEALSPDLPFALGETLEYKVSSNGQAVGNVTLQAKERKQFLGQDSLLLTAGVSKVEPGISLFDLNDSIKAQVHPETLAPQQIEIKLGGILSDYTQNTQFDQRMGFATANGTNRVEIPVGTHSLLSLAYAIRSFYLRPSLDLNNPVNDTRVAVFAGNQAYILTLRPSSADLITQRGEKVSAQLITINTGVPEIDGLNMRVWLSNDQKRLPLRFSFGNYQADLISETKVQPK